ncbi:DUF3426 domain-containing protein [Paracidovorax citrulli]|uniref:DUF3426 domain-containing protein n=1 Tax=Paracidovorax citrulli TaxID=80869 RepID=UPI00363DA9EE
MAWRVRAAAATPRPDARPVQAPVPAAPAPSVPHAAAQEAAREAGPAGASPSRPPGTSPAPRESDSGGYELPFAELRDSGWPDDDEGLDAEDSLSPQGGMPLPGRMEAASEPAPAAQGEDESPLDDAAEQAVARELAHEGIDTDTDPVDIATQAMPLPEPAMPAVAPPSPPSVWRSARALAEQGPEDADLAGRGAFAARLRNQEADDDDDPDEEGAHASGEPGFMRAARRRAWWRRPAVRIALGLAGVLLLGVLLLQVGLQERDRLASQHPALRPLLQVLCAPLQCRIAPPRRIADVVIDSSSFNKARGDGYLLSLTIRSRADFPVAMPALELTLTDAQEQPPSSLSYPITNTSPSSNPLHTSQFSFSFPYPYFSFPPFPFSTSFQTSSFKPHHLPLQLHSIHYISFKPNPNQNNPTPPLTPLQTHSSINLIPFNSPQPSNLFSPTSPSPHHPFPPHHHHTYTTTIPTHLLSTLLLFTHLTSPTSHHVPQPPFPFSSFPPPLLLLHPPSIHSTPSNSNSAKCSGVY